MSSEPSQPGSKSWDAVCPRFVNWAKFETIFDVENVVFFVFNTQFDQGIAARRNSAFVLREHVENLAVGFSGSMDDMTRTIVLGDLNTLEKSNCFSVLTRGIDMNDENGGEGCGDEDNGGDNGDGRCKRKAMMEDEDEHSDRDNQQRKRLGKRGDNDDSDAEDSGDDDDDEDEGGDDDEDDDDDDDDDEVLQLFNSTDQVGDDVEHGGAKSGDIFLEEETAAAATATSSNTAIAAVPHETFVGFIDGCPRSGPLTGTPATVDFILVSSEVRVHSVAVVDEVRDNGRRLSPHRPVVARLMI